MQRYISKTKNEESKRIILIVALNLIAVLSNLLGLFFPSLRANINNLSIVFGYRSQIAMHKKKTP